MYSLIHLLVGIGLFGFFQLVPHAGGQLERSANLDSVDRVVISAPVLLFLAGGDRYLIANIETIRVAATGIESGLVNAYYLLRAQKVISDLNPCQEHNYYIANALLSWGGASREGGEILQRASDCRFWDELPPFFYGFNRFFFERDVPGALRWLDEAAERASTNSAGYRKLAIMLQVDAFNDERLALNFLRRERAAVRDPKLGQMLDKRIERLQGLIQLREAQQNYEAKFGEPLRYPSQLLDGGVLPALPRDPLGIGYEFSGGRFSLKRLKIAGVEELM